MRKRKMCVSYLSELGVETAVDDGVVGRMRHGQPMASKDDVIDLAPPPDVWVLVSDDLQEIVRKVQSSQSNQQFV